MDLQQQINALSQELQSLKSDYYYNRYNFKELKDKKIVFNKGIIISQLSATPASGEIGELCVVGGKLYICTATTPTWVKVGLQT
jgi:hypothetical protein